MLREIFENFENNIENKNDKNIKLKNISNEELELAKKLDAIEEFTIDRFEGNSVVLENRATKEMTTINKNELPYNIKEGDIIKKINGKYAIDEIETIETEKRIKQKMEDLWNN